jgi:hypothetical protein
MGTRLKDRVWRAARNGDTPVDWTVGVGNASPECPHFAFGPAKVRLAGHFYQIDEYEEICTESRDCDE